MFLFRLISLAWTNSSPTASGRTPSAVIRTLARIGDIAHLTVHLVVTHGLDIEQKNLSSKQSPAMSP
ncbi:hypothetical protein PGT21_014686 [Puccinia graminis f. sp. tritici]|uniref:Uncharacterized protein n=1 Tax=Puccinia graminis f. sp. tritici TaxID=56615 RepID=A0A5B0M3K1_PUCGR|nr:hypothetical protein PGT21_014686 [Puccinia graminis f. sp. tritici]